MHRELNITYLYNSGFIVETDRYVLVFDYYLDKTNCLPEIIQKNKVIYFFVSHSHYDHWNPDISKFANYVTKYFLSYDIHGANMLPDEKSIILNEYDKYQDNNLTVYSYSSTDAGVSFLVEIDGWHIFHAGDFNWWHWYGDTQKNNAFARNGFLKQMKKLVGIKADVAFFPVDTRLADACDWGVKEFCRDCDVKNLITMHNVGRKPWPLAEDFAGSDKHIDVWSPQEPGQIKTIEKDEENEDNNGEKR